MVAAVWVLVGGWRHSSRVEVGVTTVATLGKSNPHLMAVVRIVGSVVRVGSRRVAGLLVIITWCDTSH